MNMATVHRNGHHSYLYDTEYNPFYEGILAHDSTLDSDEEELFHGPYRHRVVTPENNELAFRYFSFAASQNHSRSLRVLGDYYWYQLPPVDLFRHLSNLTFDLHRSTDYGAGSVSVNESDNSTEIVRVDEYDQRSMALSIAYLSTPQSIVHVADVTEGADSTDSAESAEFVEGEVVSDRVETESLERHQVIACYLQSVY